MSSSNRDSFIGFLWWFDRKRIWSVQDTLSLIPGLEKGMATHTSIPAWREFHDGEPGRPSSPWGSAKESGTTECLPLKHYKASLTSYQQQLSFICLLGHKIPELLNLMQRKICFVSVQKCIILTHAEYFVISDDMRDISHTFKLLILWFWTYWKFNKYFTSELPVWKSVL